MPKGLTVSGQNDIKTATVQNAQKCATHACFARTDFLNNVESFSPHFFFFANLAFKQLCFEKLKKVRQRLIYVILKLFCNVHNVQMHDLTYLVQGCWKLRGRGAYVRPLPQDLKSLWYPWLSMLMTG